MPLNLQSLVQSRHSTKNRSITTVQSFEIYVYMKEKVVKARVRENRRRSRRKKAEGRNTKGLLSSRSPGH